MASRTNAGTHVALLRAINVGGNNKLPMKDLVALMASLGCERPRHYIQSGNVVFQAPDPVAAKLPVTLAKAIERDFHFQVPVVLRSESELRATASRNPLLQGTDPEHLHVMFLADVPAPAAVAKLDPAKAAGGRFVVKGRDMFLHIPSGVAKWKMTNVYVDRTLQTVSTIRNWRTVLKLVEMCSEQSRS